MQIKRSRIFNLARYLGHLAGPRFQIVCNLTEVPESRLARAGIHTEFEDGDSFLPAAVGRVSRYNTEGRWITRRDLPKESRYIHTVYWQWETWNGDQHSDFRDVYRECYQREQVPPPAIELIFRQLQGGPLVASPLLTNSTADEEANKHVINLFLELFGGCDILEEGESSPPPPRVRHVNWRFLPPGSAPWDRLIEHLDRTLPIHAAGSHVVIRDRQETIYNYGPNETYIGAGGFSDYIAYEFASRNIVILESIKKDNALYVFGDDWQSCSKLSKAEVLSNSLHTDRIVHSQGWKAQLRAVMTAHPPTAR